MSKRDNNKGGASVIVVLLVIFLAFIGYGWWQGSFSHIFSHSSVTTQSVNKDQKKRIVYSVADTSQAKKVQVDSTKNNADAKADVKDVENNAVVEPEKMADLPDGHARMAIVLDDFGYSLNVVKYFNSLPIKLTYSIFPHMPYTTSIANSGYAAGKQIMLHLPMESISNAGPEKNTIRTYMSDTEIKRIAASAITSVPHVIGVNNHQGSKASSNGRVVRDVANVIKDRGLFFLDSRTIASSQIFPISRSMRIPTGKNDLFIDNSNSIADIKARLRQAAKMALHSQSKTIIVIGHDRPNTYLAIKEIYRELEAEGIEFVFVSSLVH